MGPKRAQQSASMEQFLPVSAPARDPCFIPPLSAASAFCSCPALLSADMSANASLAAAEVSRFSLFRNRFPISAFPLLPGICLPL